MDYQDAVVAYQDRIQDLLNKPTEFGGLLPGEVAMEEEDLLLLEQSLLDEAARDPQFGNKLDFLEKQQFSFRGMKPGEADVSFNQSGEYYSIAVPDASRLDGFNLLDRAVESVAESIARDVKATADVMLEAKNSDVPLDYAERELEYLEGANTLYQLKGIGGFDGVVPPLGADYKFWDYAGDGQGGFGPIDFEGMSDDQYANFDGADNPLAPLEQLYGQLQAASDLQNVIQPSQ